MSRKATPVTLCSGLQESNCRFVMVTTFVMHSGRGGTLHIPLEPSPELIWSPVQQQACPGLPAGGLPLWVQHPPEPARAV